MLSASFVIEYKWAELVVPEKVSLDLAISGVVFTLYNV